MSTIRTQRILIADDNAIVREVVAQWLRAEGHDVVTAETGERAFLALRNWSRPIDWLYARVALPGLIDGWILADEYHDMHRDKPVILSGTEARVSSRGDVVLRQPTPTVVIDVIRQVVALGRVAISAAAEPVDVRHAA
jgi:CheY-like chemotaxis protein